MKVIPLTSRRSKYSCNAYIVLGDARRAEHANGLVDVGADDDIVRRIDEAYSGVREKPVERVVLTHARPEYKGPLAAVIGAYKPDVCGAVAGDGIATVIADGETLKIGNRDFEVIATRVHGQDSILLYCEDEGVLFSGDVPLNITRPGGTYEPSYVSALEIVAERAINTIYPGFGDAITDKAEIMIRTTLLFVRQSGIAVV